MPPQEPAAGQHYYHATPNAGPQGGSYQSGAYSASTPPAGNLAHGEKHHRGFGGRMHQMGTKAAEPINALSNKLGSRAFLPTTMDKECEKAAATLMSFCGTCLSSYLAVPLGVYRGVFRLQPTEL